MNICYQGISTAQPEVAKLEWWVALQDFTPFHDTLRDALDVNAWSLLARPNDAENPQQMVRSIEDVKSELPRLKSKYYLQPLFDPAKDDESQHSTQSTILSSYASERQPEVSGDFYKPPPKQTQFSSPYGPALALISLPTSDRVETGCAALASLDQPFSTPNNNASGRGALPSDYTYRLDPTPPHNHVEMPPSYGSRAYPSQPCGYVNMSSSSASCARAQPAPTSRNWGSRLSPTAVQAYNENSYYDTLCPESMQYTHYPSPPDWSRFPVDRDLPLSHDGVKRVEDSNRPAQPYFEPIVFNGPVHTQPVLNRAQFDHANPPPPQKSQDPLLPHYNRAQSQPALNTAQFDQRPEPQPANPWSILESYSELPPMDILTNRVQFDHSQPPRHVVSSRKIQRPHLDQRTIYDQVPRQPALDSAQFEPLRRVPATRNNPNRVEAFSGSRSYLGQTAGDTAYLLQPSSRTAAAAPATFDVNLMSSSYNDTHNNPSPAYVFPSRSSLLLAVG